jgi:hypothetical protein
VRCSTGRTLFLMKRRNFKFKCIIINATKVHRSHPSEESSLKMIESRRHKFIRVILVFVFLPLAGCAATGGSQRSASDAPSVFDEKWGVRVLSIRQSAEGYMLDFRYRVIDAEKAAPLFDRKIKPHLIDEATGAKFLVPEPPKVGALRTTRPPLAGRNYFIIFANPGRYIKKGSKVTVVIGEFRAENLVVE